MKAAFPTVTRSMEPVPLPQAVLQRKCACGRHTSAGGECESCKSDKLHRSTSVVHRPLPLPPSAISRPDDPSEREADRIAEAVMSGSMPSFAPAPEPAPLQRAATAAHVPGVPAIVNDVLASPGQPLDAATRAFFEPRFGQDLSRIRVHTDAKAAESAEAVRAEAYTVGTDIAVNRGLYAPHTVAGKRLMAHELAHATLQPTSVVQRRAAPYIDKVTVHLTPPQSAELHWLGTAPKDAPGLDAFTVSTGKGYSNPGDPPGTCTRDCCNDPDTQCAPPWNQPGTVGACCTYHGSSYWTGTPMENANWPWWTPIQPYYSRRHIALHAHDEVTGQPIGHGCVRMDYPNAERIWRFSNGRRTRVVIDGRAAPVDCPSDRRCGGDATGAADSVDVTSREAAASTTPIPGLEGELS